MKNFFLKIKNWFIAHKPTKRRIIQLYVALLYNANIKGFFTGKISTAPTKNVCVPGFNCYSCPGAIGACPLGSLQNALGSSKTSTIAYVFGILVLFGLLLGRTICGFLCPMGLLQDLVYKIRSPKLPKSKFTRILSYFKYVLLLVFVFLVPLAYSQKVTLPAFCQYICPVGTLAGLGFLPNPNNAGEFVSLGSLFTWKFCLAVIIIVGAIFVYRLFCRFLCPLGALYGFFCKLAMLGIKLDKQKCIDCGLCVRTCKVDIHRVGDHECIQCGACVSVCPTKAISWKGSKFFILENETEIKNSTSEKVDLKAVMDGQKNLSNVLVTVEKESERASESVATQNEKSQEKSTKKKNGLLYILRKNNGKGFKIIALTTAIAVLVSALVYFNFIHEETVADLTYKVGDVMQDFQAKEFFSEDGKYSLSEDSGKIVVLNFWYIGCAGCESEMPEFGVLAKDERYRDKVSIVVVHSNDEDGMYGAERLVEYNGKQMFGIEKYILDNKSKSDIEEQNWDSFYSNVKWLIDFNGDKELYLALGGSGAWPMTAIIDGDGVVKFITSSSVDKDLLYREIDKILAE